MIKNTYLYNNSNFTSIKYIQCFKFYLIDA